MLRVLQTGQQIEDARKGLRARGCDMSVGWRRTLFEALYRARFRVPAPEPAINKSWDVLTMLDLIEHELPDRRSRLFDMGSYNCEIPLALWQRGYRNIRAADFNPLGRSIRWYGNRIDFHCEDFYKPAIGEGTLDGITALSVIEHGYDEERLLRTLSTLLRPGGIACLTTDYREQKIEVPADYRIFGLTWRVFSRAEIERLVARATAFGLELVGDVRWSESELPVHFEGYAFTFALLALRKAG
jgi:SAM-dependent methyltransferase